MIHDFFRSHTTESAKDNIKFPFSTSNPFSLSAFPTSTKEPATAKRLKDDIVHLAANPHHVTKSLSDLFPSYYETMRVFVPTRKSFINDFQGRKNNLVLSLPAIVDKYFHNKEPNPNFQSLLNRNDILLQLSDRFFSNPSIMIKKIQKDSEELEDQLESLIHFYQSGNASKKSSREPIGQTSKTINGLPFERRGFFQSENSGVQPKSANEPLALFLQRNPPSHQDNRTPNGHHFHQLYHPRLAYHLQYLSTQETYLTQTYQKTSGKNQQFERSTEEVDHQTEIVGSNNLHISNKTISKNKVFSTITNEEVVEKNKSEFRLEEKLDNGESIGIKNSGDPKCSSGLKCKETIETFNSSWNKTSPNKTKILSKNSRDVSGIKFYRQVSDEIKGNIKDEEVENKSRCSDNGECNQVKEIESSNEIAQPSTNAITVKPDLNFENYSFNYPNQQNLNIYFNRNLEILRNNTNIIFNSDIVHPHQLHLQFKHEQEQLLKQQQQKTNLVNQGVEGTSNQNDAKTESKYQKPVAQKEDTKHEIRKQKTRKVQHHHHALLPPSMQVPVPPSRTPYPLGYPPLAETPPPTIPLLNGIPSYFDFGNGYLQRPIWGYWYFW